MEHFFFWCINYTWRMWHIGKVTETHLEGCRFVPRHDLFRNTIFVSCAITNNTNCVSFIALTVPVKHVVGRRNKQVLPQWICLRCNIQFDNMGSVIFFQCASLRRRRKASKSNDLCRGPTELVLHSAYRGGSRRRTGATSH